MLKKIVLATTVALAALLTATQSQAQQDRRVWLRNHTSQNIVEFHATNTAESDWGDDLLGLQVLRPSWKQQFNLDDGTGRCLFDLEVIFRDGTRVVHRNMDICHTDSWTLTD